MAVGFRDRLLQQNMTPLWDVFKELVAKQPNSGCEPTLWRYTDVRPAVLEAGGVKCASAGERREVNCEKLVV